MRERRWVAAAASMLLLAGAVVAMAPGAIAKPPTSPNSPVVSVAATPTEVDASDAAVTLTVTVNRQAKSVVSCVVTGAAGGPSCGTAVTSDKYSSTFHLNVTGSPWAEGSNTVGVTVGLSNGGSASGSTTVTATLGDDWSAYVGCLSRGRYSYEYIGPKDTFGNAPMYWNGDCSGPPAESIWGTNSFVEADTNEEANARCNALDPGVGYNAAPASYVGFPAPNAWTCII